MISLIENIFDDMGFRKTQLKCGVAYEELFEGGSSGYWLIREESDLPSVLDRQDAWLTELRNTIDSRTVNKNSTLILLVNRDKVTLENQSKHIISIEDDPFQFKKHVLEYSETEVTDLEKERKAHQKPLLTFIKEMAVSRECFNLYKSQFAKSWASLMYRVIIKVPVIKIPVSIEKEFQTLYELREIHLRNGDLHEINEICWKLMADFDETSLLKLDPIKLLHYFVKE